MKRSVLVFAFFVVAWCGAVLVTGPADAQATLPPEPVTLSTLEKNFARAQDEYLGKLEGYLPDAYERRFADLTDEQLAEIARTRRLWQHYTLTRTKTDNFQETFLKPIDAVAQLLLIKPEQIEDETVARARKEAWRLGQQLMDLRRQKEVDIDPTKNMKAPTGIPYPPLDQPHTCLDTLRLYERSLVLAQTIAPPQAKAILMKNPKRCALIDVEEAAFVMYGNQVRMLTGTYAWVADPLTTACARDHSVDRKNGLASGHSSTVPGKEGMRDRLNRFGAKGMSEGAGGGTGESYIRGLSYGGGHTGPLYSLLRNMVGPGRSDGAFTSIYYTDNAFKHPCHATQGELFLPPGVEKSDMRNRTLRTAYTGFYKDQFEKAYDALAEEEPADGFEGVIHRYLLARLDAEVQWTVTGIKRIAAAGDLAEAYVRFQDAQKSMRGIPAFDAEAESLKGLFEGESVEAEVKAGKIFRRICGQQYTKKNMKKLIELYPDTVYAKAAQKCIDDDMPTKGSGPLTFFVERDSDLNRWGYVVNY